MTDLSQALAELRALRDHVAELNAQYVDKGFSMARETQQRLAKASVHIQSGEGFTGSPEQASAWIAQAEDLAAMLRIEAGGVVEMASVERRSAPQS
jgi:hypothetical protein